MNTDSNTLHFSTGNEASAVLQYVGNDDFASVNYEAGKRTRYRKDLIRVGEYKKDGRTYSITDKDLSQLAESFSRMYSAGVTVPLTLGHTMDAEKGRGRLTHVEKQGDTLYGVVEFSDDEAEKLRTRAEVSVGIKRNLQDGKGTTYPLALEHVALVLNPLVPGQGGFKALAASRDGEAFLFDTRENTGKVTNMDYLKKIAAMLGITVTDGMTEAALLTAIEAACKEMQASTADAKKKAAEAGGDAGKEKVAALMSMESEALGYACESALARISALETSGRITPAAKKKLTEIVDRAEKKKEGCAMFSRSTAQTLGITAENKSIFTTVLDLLESIEPKDLVSAYMSRPENQGVEFSRSSSGKNNAGDTDDDVRIQHELAGVPYTPPAKK